MSIVSNVVDMVKNQSGVRSPAQPLMSRGDALVWLQNQGGENYATLQSLGMPEENALDASAALAYNRAKRARETTTTVGFLAGVGGLAIGWIVWGRKRK